jgi:hypothetical protein
MHRQWPLGEHCARINHHYRIILTQVSLHLHLSRYHLVGPIGCFSERKYGEEMKQVTPYPVPCNI